MAPTVTMSSRAGPVPGGAEVDPVEFASRFVDQMTNKDLKFSTLYQCLLGADGKFGNYILL